MNASEAGSGGGTKKKKHPKKDKGIIHSLKNPPKKSSHKKKADGLSAFKDGYKALNKANNAQIFNKPKKPKKPAPKPAPTGGMAGLEPNKYHGTTSSNVPKSKVAPQQRKVPSKPKPVTHATAPSKPTVHAYTAAKKPVVKPTTPTTPTTPKKPVPTTASKPVAAPVKPPAHVGSYKDMSTEDSSWYNSYSGAIGKGENNSYNLKRYQDLSKQYGLKQHHIGDSALQNMSIKALSGDKNAQTYLKNMNYSMGKDKVWNGVSNDQLNGNNSLRQAYMKDNPLADYTKNYDMSNYNSYNDMIQNNKPMTQWQKDWYNNTVSKWSLDDFNDPLVQYQNTLKNDKQDALNAQDVALNTGMGQMDANSFQQFQQLQQQMSDRGMGDSGIAQDTYMRAQMANNQNYQQAFSDAATKKSDIQSQYDDAINQAKLDQRDYADGKEAAASAAQAALQQQQSEQDKYLTTSTGYVYLNGQVLKDGSGKPITSVDYQKMSETQRHNLATEGNTAQKNANDYALGADKNDIARTKIASDLQQSIAKNTLDYAKLDYNYAKLESTNAYNQDKIRIAADNAQTSKDKNQLNALGKQADNLAKQIIAAQKAGKKPSKKIVDQYNQTNDAISKLVGGASFNSSGGGGDVDYNQSDNGVPSNFGGYRQYGKQPAIFNTHMSQAIAKGLPFGWAKQMTELVGRESSFKPNVKNPTSSAHGYAQFLNSTVANYKKKYPNLDYNNPVDQLVLMYHYVKDRYGTPQNALAQWEHRSPHWY